MRLREKVTKTVKEMKEEDLTTLNINNRDTSTSLNMNSILLNPDLSKKSADKDSSTEIYISTLTIQDRTITFYIINTALLSLIHYIFMKVLKYNPIK